MTVSIRLGDCLDVFANERNVPAFVSDPPANIEFMGRSWDGSEPALDYAPMIPARDKAHLREMQIEHSFSRYWAKRYAMAYDIADQHAVNIVWTLPRTSHQTANALRAAGWRIKDNLVHLFGTGWAKSGNALAPGQEGWLIAVKGKPDLDIDACRVPRGTESLNGGAYSVGGRSGFVGDNRSASSAGMFAPGAKSKREFVQPNGSIPKNALLSHCEECVRVGVKQAGSGKLGIGSVRAVEQSKMETGWGGSGVRHAPDAYGTESVQAWHCLAGCVCGARSKWDPEKPLPRCPCGETWRWLCAVAEVNAQSGSGGTGKMIVGGPDRRNNGVMAARYNSHVARDRSDAIMSFGDQGGASRFFNIFSYLSKCSSSERHAGCENLFWKANKKNPFGFGQVTREEWEALPADQRAQGNVHPTVKSYRLMHWLHSITGAKRVLDFTAGSGTGMYTAYLDDIDWLGAEICPEAITIANARYAFWTSLHPDALAMILDNKPTTEAIRKNAKATAKQKEASQ